MLPQVYSITILERHPEKQLQDQGAGIHIGEEVQEFVSRYASIPPDQYAIAGNLIRILDTEGTLLISREVKRHYMTTWGQLFRVLKVGFLHSDTGGSRCEYRYSCNVSNIVERSSKVEVSFTNTAGNEETAMADLVIGADGASSTVRDLMLPGIKRTYAGYVLLRGLVPIEQLSDSAVKVLDRSGTICLNRNSQTLSYTVPGTATFPPEESISLNWGWYCATSEEELAELMTDVNSVRHTFTLPPGGMRSHLAEEIRTRAQSELAPQFAEAVGKTKAPFVQVVTDAWAGENVFQGGKVLLVGDAAAGQR